MMLKNSNGIFEVRMREMDLSVGRIMAIVFCAPKHKCIYYISTLIKYEIGFWCWALACLHEVCQGLGWVGGDSILANEAGRCNWVRWSG